MDDAIESGGTMMRLLDHLRLYRPRSLATATLLVKPGRRQLDVQQFHGHEVDTDDILVGYGLPWEDKLRNLPYVARLSMSNPPT